MELLVAACRSLLSESSESVVTMSRSYVKDLLRNFESLNCSMQQTVQVSTDWQKSTHVLYLSLMLVEVNT